MLNRQLFAGLILIATGLLAGCAGDGQPSPFEGDWVSTDAGRLRIDGDRWSDGDGDSGDFEFSGKYPTFTVIFESASGPSQRLAEFKDKRTFDLCEIGAGNLPVECVEFVFDQHTVWPP